jgi:hypothetical protein
MASLNGFYFSTLMGVGRGDNSMIGLHIVNLLARDQNQIPFLGDFGGLDHSQVYTRLSLARVEFLHLDRLREVGFKNLGRPLPRAGVRMIWAGSISNFCRV